MDKRTSTLLPYILGLLSRQPELRVSRDYIIKHIQDAVMYEHVSPFGSLKNAVDFAIGVGQTTKVLTLVDEEVTSIGRIKFGRPVTNELPPEAVVTPSQARKLIQKRMPRSRATSSPTRKATARLAVGKNKGGRVAKAPKRPR